MKFSSLFLSISLVGILFPAVCAAESVSPNVKIKEFRQVKNSLSQMQQAIIPIAAFAASGDMDQLKQALNQGLKQGLTINEIAEKIFISPDTVKFHRRKLFEKMGVDNITEALSYATNNKLL